MTHSCKQSVPQSLWHAGEIACVAAELAVVDVDMVGVESGAGLLAGIVGCPALGEVG
jgi:hypothetical protein